MPEPDYRDDYSTCLETYATLRVCSRAHEVDLISNYLGLSPTRHRESNGANRTTVWSMSSEGSVASRDSRRHIDWLLDRLEPAAEQLSKLRCEGAETEIICYWVSSGQGGPWLLPQQLTRLGALGLSIWWDIYFEDQSQSDAALS